MSNQAIIVNKSADCNGGGLPCVGKQCTDVFMEIERKNRTTDGDLDIYIE